MRFLPASRLRKLFGTRRAPEPFCRVSGAVSIRSFRMTKQSLPQGMDMSVTSLNWFPLAETRGRSFISMRFHSTRIPGSISRPIERPANDWNADMNYYKENWLGGDHEFKFGFDYKTAKGHTFSSYGNGIYLTDYYQTLLPQDAGFALTSGCREGTTLCRWSRSFEAHQLLRNGYLP